MNKIDKKKFTTKYRVLSFLFLIATTSVLVWFILNPALDLGPIFIKHKHLISDRQALGMVTNLPEVQNFIAKVKDHGGNYVIEVDPKSMQQQGGNQVWKIHVYESFLDHEAEMNWYSVNAKTGSITDEQDNAVNAREVNVFLEVSDDRKFLDILKNGQKIKTIYTKDVPLFDALPNNSDGIVPEKDYAFYLPDSDSSMYDSFRNRVYFVVYNQASAGNANADRALVSYDLNSSKINVLLSRLISVSFAEYKLSPDGHYLAFSDGGHGGACYNVQTLGIFDLKTNKELHFTDFDINSKGPVYKAYYFDYWSGNDSFNYKEDTTDHECLLGSKNIKTVERSYQIKP